MTRIALLSDTHGYLDPSIFSYLQDRDEIWHAGDIGRIEVLDQLQGTGKIVRAVYGNIDGRDIRLSVPAELVWETDGMKIAMVHIGGHPGHYAPGIKTHLEEWRPDVFICGHSHILRVIYDKNLHLLYLNPGACGKEGFHPLRSMLRFSINAGRVQDMAVIELGKR